MRNKYFVKFYEHSDEFYTLIRYRPTAFILLAIIAERARKVPSEIDDGIEVGEALIGDFEKYRVTHQIYRTDKQCLEKFGLATFRTTNRGTIAKIVNSSIFDISRASLTNKLTVQQQSNNMQQTTKQEVRSEKKERGASQAIEKNSFFQDMPVSSPQEYWDLNAPIIAEDMGIELDSWKYINGNADWLRKGKIRTRSSIKAFLECANDWDTHGKY